MNLHIIEIVDQNSNTYWQYKLKNTLNKTCRYEWKIQRDLFKLMQTASTSTSFESPIFDEVWRL